jgi:hypothetical protein
MQRAMMKATHSFYITNTRFSRQRYRFAASDGHRVPAFVAALPTARLAAHLRALRAECRAAASRHAALATRRRDVAPLPPEFDMLTLHYATPDDAMLMPPLRRRC